jgi:predicted DNA-binding WGR domain protein
MGSVPEPAPVDGQLVAHLAARAAAGGGLVLELLDPPPEGRRARWYALHLQPALWDGGVDVVRQWGRIGARHHPRRLVTPHPTEAAARAVLPELLRRRLRRGYLPVR